MKIAGICASPRKSQSRTAQLVNKLLQYAGAMGAETEFIDLGQQKISYCAGCGQCHKLGHCAQKDVKEVTDRLLSADGFVLGSPVYIYHVTAQMKTFIDHLGHFIHCQRLAGKYGVALTTTAGSGEVETTDYLEWLVTRTGAMCVDKKAFIIWEDGLLPDDYAGYEEVKKLAQDLVNSIKEQRTFAEQVQKQEEFRKYFSYVITRRQEQWSWEYRYWEEKGWF